MILFHFLIGRSFILVYCWAFADCFRLLASKVWNLLLTFCFAIGWPHCCKWWDYPSQSYFTNPSTPLQRKAILCWSHWPIQWGNHIFWHNNLFMLCMLDASYIWLIHFLCFQVEFKTASGQLLDLITTHEGEKDLTKYNLTV